MFSIFDPVRITGLALRLNWVSLIVVFFRPSYYWIIKRKNLKRVGLLLSFLAQELRIVVGRNSSSTKLLLIGLFLFVLVSNLGGLLPYVFTPHRHLSITLSLGLPFWLGYILFNFVNNTRSALAHLVPRGTPTVLVPFIVLIELIRNIIRPLTLRIRLAANMVAGHLLLRLLSLPAPRARFFILRFLAIGLVLLRLLELGVSFIQSYVFITLSSLYISEVNHIRNN